MKVAIIVEYRPSDIPVKQSLMIERQPLHPKTGILLVNLGTPAYLQRFAVSSWLTEFLMDPDVVDLPWPLRALLVHGLIRHVRTPKTLEAYRKIWTPDGSPLLVHMRQLAIALQQTMHMKVVVGMRYGDTDLREGLARLSIAGIEDVLVAPLYPQYAQATTGSSWRKVREVAKEFDLSLRCLPPFYADDGYLSALACHIAGPMAESDALLFSYHGLPVRHIKNADPSGTHCLQAEKCCGGAHDTHATCYRHQAMITSERVADQLNLGDKPYFVSFQSRFGLAQWLQPFTDQLLAALPAKGITKLCVVCPSFVADNLETLEEINIRGREIFMQAGGKAFHFVPCLNTEQNWVLALSHLCLLALQDSNPEH